MKKSYSTSELAARYGHNRSLHTLKHLIQSILQTDPERAELLANQALFSDVCPSGYKELLNLAAQQFDSAISIKVVQKHSSNEQALRAAVHLMTVSELEKQLEIYTLQFKAAIQSGDYERSDHLFCLASVVIERIDLMQQSSSDAQSTFIAQSRQNQLLETSLQHFVVPSSAVTFKMYERQLAVFTSQFVAQIPLLESRIDEFVQLQSQTLSCQTSTLDRLRNLEVIKDTRLKQKLDNVFGEGEPLGQQPYLQLWVIKQFEKFTATRFGSYVETLVAHQQVYDDETNRIISETLIQMLKVNESLEQVMKGFCFTSLKGINELESKRLKQRISYQYYYSKKTELIEMARKGEIRDAIRDLEGMESNEQLQKFKKVVIDIIEFKKSLKSLL